MQNLAISEIISIVSLFGFMVSLIFLAWQSRSVAHQAKISNSIAGATALGDCVSSLREVLKMILTDPKLYPYFYEGLDIRPEGYATRRTARRVTLVAEMYADVLETSLIATKLVESSKSHEDWISYSEHMLKKSPTIKRLALHHPKWWPTLHLMAGGPRSTDL